MSNYEVITLYLKMIEEKGLNNFVNVELEYLFLTNIDADDFKIAHLIASSEVLELVYKEIGLNDFYDLILVNGHYTDILRDMIKTARFNGRLTQ